METNNIKAKNFRNIILWTAVLFLFAACTGTTDHGEEEGPAEDACEHMADGPAAGVTALENMSASLAAVAADHRRYDITLPAGTTSYVSFEADEENDFFFALSSDLPFQVFDATNATLTAENSETADLPCSEVAVLHTYELPMGSYKLSFQSTAETSVSLVAVEGEHDHD